MTTPDWAEKAAQAVMCGSWKSLSPTAQQKRIAEALRTERREAYERGAADMKERAAAVADYQASDLNAWSQRLKADGDEEGMYRANTAFHRVVAVAEAIRAIPAPAALEEK